MRKMFLMKGAPASGKSTFLRENGFSDMAVGYDDARELFSPVLVTTDGNGSRAIGRAAEKAVVSVVEEAVKHRVDMGATVFVDNTFVTSASQKPFHKIAEKMGYEVIIIDMQGNLTDEELLRRNALRGHKAVPASVVTKMAASHRNGKNFGNPRVISPDEVQSELTQGVENLSGHKIVIVGDVQGCAGPLNKMIAAEVDDNTVVIFVGDLFDRGPANGQVMQSVNRLKNKIKVRGNHDEHLFRVKSGDFSPSRFQQTRETIRQLVNGGVSDKALRKFAEDYTPVYLFSHGSEKFIVTHGGIDPAILEQNGDGYMTGLRTEREYIIGLSQARNTYEYRGDYDVDTDKVLSERTVASEWTAQFHGHRNKPMNKADAFPGVYTLESKVEEGGYLSTAIIEPDGSIRVRYDV